ncbi:hypothetical protein [Thiohalophilus sp.]|uniref:hypothetical protein n=1 Tax=Thiohalophilus sp. TaxID=3028392 RepID=UPI002ACEA581|nr:hypothetical protein [Thiohalophilus sp.]MDZ7804321.1 hypothetical protein [Thiohalophilus sp.]
MSSWVIVDKRTGKAVFENFDAKTATEVRERHAETHKVIPIMQWLTSLNNHGGLNEKDPVIE